MGRYGIIRRLFKDRYDSCLNIIAENEDFFFGYLSIRGIQIDNTPKMFCKKMHKWEEYDAMTHRFYVSRCRKFEKMFLRSPTGKVMPPSNPSIAEIDAL